MTAGPVFTSRLSGRRLLGSDGLSIGRVRDVVILRATPNDPPRALGLVVTVQRRQIFVSLGRVAEMTVDGVTLDGTSVDLGRFSVRAGEILASALYDKPAGNGVVLDIGIARSDGPRRLASLRPGAGHRRGLRRHAGTLVAWEKYAELFDSGEADEQIAGLRDMHPTDLANVVDSLPAAGRRQLADALQDEELADVLQEMPEQDQIGFLAGLGIERIADVIEQMEPDDAADLLAEMPAAERDQLFAAMLPGDRGPPPPAELRRHDGRRPDDIQTGDRDA